MAGKIMKYSHKKLSPCHKDQSVNELLLTRKENDA